MASVEYALDSQSTPMPRFSPNELATLAAHALARAGARQSMAEAAAEALVAAMLAEEGVRVPGERRFALARAATTSGIDLPDALLAELRRLAEA